MNVIAFLILFPTNKPENVDANLGLNTGLNKQLSAITSIPTAWYWTYTSASSALVADVSYDMWLSTSSGGSSSDEIMIWLSTRNGAGPAGSLLTTATVSFPVLALFLGLPSLTLHRSLVLLGSCTRVPFRLGPSGRSLRLLRSLVSARISRPSSVRDDLAHLNLKCSNFFPYQRTSSIAKGCPALST